MHINAFFTRSSASSDVARMFKPVESAMPGQLTWQASPLSPNKPPFVSSGALPKSIHKAVQIILDILADANPAGPSSAVLSKANSAYAVFKGSDGADSISHASISSRSAQVTAYIDGGAGDDQISFASNSVSHHEIHGGSGNDRIAAAGAYLGVVSGGEGDDAMAVSGQTVFMVDGGSGNDAIAVAGSVISVVAGGAGDDAIAVSGDYVTVVEGGEGDDTISISSRNALYGHVVDGNRGPVRVDGGKGDDTISIDGQAHVFFLEGDGRDVVTISDRTTFDFWKFGEKMLNLKDAVFTQENGILTVAFAGKDDKLIIQSASGDLKFEQTGDHEFVVTPV